MSLYTPSLSTPDSSPPTTPGPSLRHSSLEHRLHTPAPPSPYSGSPPKTGCSPPRRHPPIATAKQYGESDLKGDGVGAYGLYDTPEESSDPQAALIYSPLVICPTNHIAESATPTNQTAGYPSSSLAGVVDEPFSDVELNQILLFLRQREIAIEIGKGEEELGRFAKECQRVIHRLSRLHDEDTRIRQSLACVTQGVSRSRPLDFIAVAQRKVSQFLAQFPGLFDPRRIHQSPITPLGFTLQRLGAAVYACR